MLRRSFLSLEYLYYSTKHHRNFTATIPRSNVNRDGNTQGNAEEPNTDFRPPWVYQTSRLVSYLVIPGIAFYSVLIHDFGDHEHVFQPIRRWVARQKASFFSLSAEEEKLLKQSYQSGSKS
ncbi:hypothetical protein L218DRAFT_894458 [Marasmius fiardii PR-910]|nr:hypothetical protein L218DRAFT_894458 [Marasmius fiardii PR-910]